MCSPDSSDQIGIEQGIESAYQSAEVAEEVIKHSPYLKEIYFAGGEPMLDNDHFKIIEHLVKTGEAKNVELKYSTNCTTIRDKWFDLAKHFKTIKMQLSIDSIGSRAFYVRHPSKWDIIEKNIDRLLLEKPKNTRLSIDTALHNMTLFGIPELMLWAENKGIKQNFIEVTSPRYLQIHILPNIQKEIIIEQLHNSNKTKNLVDNKWLSRIEEMIKKDPTVEEVRQFKEYIKYTENFRNIKINDYCPEFKEWFNEL